MQTILQTTQQTSHQKLVADPCRNSPVLRYTGLFLREMAIMRKQASICLLLLLALGACVTTPEPVKEQKVLAFPEPPDPAKFYFEKTILGSMDVTPMDGDALGLEALLTGSVDIGGGSQFGKPYGVAARGGRIYVSDTVNRSVMMLDPRNGKVKDIGTENPGMLSKPLGLDIDGQGNLYVMDATKKWVMVYDRDGNYLRAIGGPDFFDRPSSVAVNPEGTLAFAVDTGSSRGDSAFHRVQIFNAQTGEHISSIGKRGSGDGEFNLARDAAVGPDGLLYVVDAGNFRVQVFDQSGKFLRKFGSVGTRLGQMARPKGVGIDKDGNLYISDTSHGNFQIFNSKGQLLMFIGTRGKNERAKYLLPAMISVDEDGRIYMVDQAYKKVDIYRPANLKEGEGSLGLAFEAMKMLKPKDKDKK